jgi:hypothetical protein
LPRELPRRSWSSILSEERSGIVELGVSIGMKTLRF